MAVIRYEPWNLLNQLQQELERTRDNKSGEGAVATAEWAPAVDIKEESDKFVIHADIPGVKPEAIEVSMEAGVLTVKGDKETEAKTEKEDILQDFISIITSFCAKIYGQRRSKRNTEKIIKELCCDKIK